MFINLAPNNKRGTANSTLLTAWDLGMGLGIIFGGIVAENWGYGTAFWVAWLINALGVIIFFSLVKKHFLRNKLR